jgi:hypothetical protein
MPAECRRRANALREAARTTEDAFEALVFILIALEWEVRARILEGEEENAPSPLEDSHRQPRSPGSSL